MKTQMIPDRREWKTSEMIHKWIRAKYYFSYNFFKLHAILSGKIKALFCDVYNINIYNIYDNWSVTNGKSTNCIYVIASFYILREVIQIIHT